MKKTGLFFGSYNPVHIGHLILANYILENSDMDELWFVVSPQNPLKEKKSLLKDYNRLEMVNLALSSYPKMKSCDVEFSMPTPSYTVDTLAYLKEKYPEHYFSLIMGEDNLSTLHKWRNHEYLLENHDIIVYPRKYEAAQEATPDNQQELLSSNKKKIESHPNVHFIEAPIIEISATIIRKMINEEKNTKPMLPPEVYDYIEGSNFYKN